MQLRDYLVSCSERIKEQGNDSEYLLVSLDELKKNIPKNQVLFYTGTDDKYHHMVIYYDRTAKISVGFKVDRSAFTPKQTVAFNGNYYLKQYPFRLSEIKN